ncbi:putative spastin like protein spas-1 [Astathelohania contejeani]|uniref:Spastin like protein spas-1 n=1 Tax=Astathelohania contejeani TaxID=164912 RepID=A0ABQ7I1Z8_9MICR|nr:putative spastin like protein spas-1 [Thelohania contejeani]
MNNQKIDDKEIPAILELYKPTLYHIHKHPPKRRDEDITIDLISLLVYQRLVGVNNRKSRNPSGFNKFKMLGLLLSVLSMGIIIYLNRGQFGINDLNSNFIIENDVSKFESIPFYGKQELLDDLVAYYTRIIYIIETGDINLMHAKLSPVKKNLLLYGPPGTGKTLLVKKLVYYLDLNLKHKLLRKLYGDMKYRSMTKSEIDKEIKKMDGMVRFIFVQPSNLARKYVGETEQLIRELIRMASRNQKGKATFVFIDEIDAFTGDRDKDEAAYMNNMKSELLGTLDGANNNIEDCMMIIGATNYEKKIDPSFLRRFELKIFSNVPEANERKELINSFLSNHKYGFDTQQIKQLVEASKGLSQSQISRVFSMANDTSVEIDVDYSFDYIKDLFESYSIKGKDPKENELIPTNFSKFENRRQFIYYINAN